MSKRILQLESLEQRVVLDAGAGPIAMGMQTLEMKSIELDHDPRDFMSPPMGEYDGPVGLDRELGERDRPNDSPRFDDLAARHFMARLRGDNEVPAVESDVQGFFQMRLLRDGETLGFQLSVPRIAGATAAHLHLGAAGTNGPVIVSLMEVTEQDNERGDPAEGEVNSERNRPTRDGLFVRGRISAADLTETVASMDELLEKVRSGEVYVNVHTDQNPAGEVRGQLRGLEMRPRHNPTHRMDVNNDNRVTPRDALSLVNHMNEHGARYVEMSLDGAMEPPYYDTNGDNLISPADIMSVINYINELVDNPGEIDFDSVSETVYDIASALALDTLEIADLNIGDLEAWFGAGHDYGEVIDRVQQHFDDIYEDVVNGELAIDEWLPEFGLAEQDVDELYGELRDQFEGLPTDWRELEDVANDFLGSVARDVRRWLS